MSVLQRQESKRATRLAGGFPNPEQVESFWNRSGKGKGRQRKIWRTFSPGPPPRRRSSRGHPAQSQPRAAPLPERFVERLLHQVGQASRGKGLLKQRRVFTLPPDALL